MKNLLFKGYLLVGSVIAWMLAGIIAWSVKTKHNDGNWLVITFGLLFICIAILFMYILYLEINNKWNE